MYKIILLVLAAILAVALAAPSPLPVPNPVPNPQFYYAGYPALTYASPYVYYG